MNNKKDDNRGRLTPSEMGRRGWKSRVENVGEDKITHVMSKQGRKGALKRWSKHKGQNQEGGN